MHRLHEILEKTQAHHPDAQLDLVRKAYVFSAKVHRGQTRLSGEPYLVHPLAVAEILADLHMDEVTVASGLLHDTLEDTLATREELAEHFGPEVAQIVEGLTKLAKVSYSSRREEQAENFRRLILTMARDVRVVLVKLADRLHNMRTLDYLPRPRQIQIAQETLDIYAPLANRLGIHRLKSELQDLGFRYAEPEIFDDLARKVEKRLAERENYVEEVTEFLNGILRAQEVEGRVSGRPKHLYSIYRKMVEQDIDFEKVYDFIAFRMIVESLRDCYAVLGAIHAQWTPIPGRFKDYIALPKPNLYQSLHTTVIGPHGQPMEMQIRTEEMHRIAEEGIAAHWRYKEKRGSAGPEEKIFQWLRQLVDANKEVGDAQEFLETVKVDLFPEVVYVFTPAGDVMELPRGSTPVDFAYAVHSKVGEQCVGAKVNERMVPLDHRLKNGDRVEIITSKHHTPSSDWLEFVQTSKARNKIRAWIKTRQRERSVELGREICDREFRKIGKSFSKALKEGDLDPVAQKFGFNRPDELLEAVGYGKLPARHILTKLYPELEEREPEEAKRARRPRKAPKGILISGVGDAMVRFARCCNPLPGEPVIGFITRGYGMAVHTEDCPNVRKLDPDRRVAVEWGRGEEGSHPVKIRVHCDDRKGILASITQTLAQFDANVVRADVKASGVGQAECNFEILVENLDRLQKILGAILAIRGVGRVERVKT
ncbi:MAG: bifunctional (p)ppGpp synthetase/guanosine-3',5'-bis(diphosphate) 3'-pyrophosphohydrolase [Deltaproteobacteria bacterium]|nr:bifunctional (p)ppGpp synthetase/guanosine-3',5'-bis(diphosphate) 3'-pyrophosphohydrolase [Deltaproteobacteria bacterium]